MLTGVNWTSNRSLPAVKELLVSGVADYCEILIDNFLHLEPSMVMAEIGESSAAVHIMWSRFLERDRAALKRIGRHIRSYIGTMQPLYVSDHIALFTHHGRRLPLLAEIDYDTSYATVRARIEEWQDILGCPIAIENFPSTLDVDGKQIQFYEKLLNETGCDLLFDVSNAVIAEINCAVPVSDWHRLAARSNHFHVAGFRLSDTNPPIAIDTHDAALEQKTLNSFRAILGCKSDSAIKTLTVERDAKIEYEEWRRDLITIRELYARSISVA